MTKTWNGTKINERNLQNGQGHASEWAFIALEKKKYPSRFETRILSGVVVGRYFSLKYNSKGTVEYPEITDYKYEMRLKNGIAE